MSLYIEKLYNEFGYVEGENIVPLQSGGHNIKFFVSNGESVESDIKLGVKASLAVGEIGIVYVPELSKIMMGTSDGFVEFLGGINIQDIINSTEFVNAVKENSQITLVSADIVASDGSVVANGTITQIDATTFSIGIPTELVGTNYNIVFSGA